MGIKKKSDTNSKQKKTSKSIPKVSTKSKVMKNNASSKQKEKKAAKKTIPKTSTQKKNVFDGADHVYTTPKFFVRLDSKVENIKDKSGRITDRKVISEKRKYYRKNNPKYIEQNHQHFMNGD